MTSWQEERSLRYAIAESIIRTGCPWLDDGWFGGINKEQLFLVAARTGVGKTHFGVQMATAASRQGKRVFYFALEASRGEIERRRLYTEIHRVAKEHISNFQMPLFREWLHLGPSPEWEGIENVATANIDKLNATLSVKYRTGSYSPDEFQQDVVSLIHESPDLIVLDHLHHFWLEGIETEALKTTIRLIDRLKNETGIPMLVLAQVRKGDTNRFQKTCLSKIEDIRGTASLTDIATDVMVASRVPPEIEKELPGGLYNPMFFHLGKSRTAPQMQKFVASVGFDYRTGEYQNFYFLSANRDFENPLPITKDEIPAWAKNAKPTALGLSETVITKSRGRKDWE